MGSQPTTANLVSVVVPTKNNVDTIENCLRSIRAQTIPVELIVIDNFSNDDTATIAKTFAHRFESGGPERSAQRNRGLELAVGEFVCFVDSDMVLDPGVLAEAIDQLTENPHMGGVIIPEHATGEGFLAACRGLEKRLYQGNPDVEAARVFSTSLARRVGGYRQDLCGGEDWDFSDRVEALGATIGRTKEAIWHEEGRVVLTECFATKRYYGRGFASYLENRTDGRKRRLNRPGMLFDRRLLRAPHLACGLFVLKVVEVAGLSLGLIEGRRGLS